jgi:hypothetical protein
LRNVYLKDKTAVDIDGQVAKLLKDLGNPEPPLSLDVVRAVLELDREYYSSGNDGALREFIHTIKMAGKGLITEPTRIVEVVRKFDLKALWLPDQDRILLDQSLPVLKHRWVEAHEIGHSIIPWHKLLTLGDDKQTLLPVCHAQLEDQANFAAGRLLFLRDRFERQAKDSAPSIKLVRHLGGCFGNTITSTLWRFVELLDAPAVGMVTVHPRRLPEDFDPAEPCRYFVRSRTFAQRFAKTSEISVFAMVQGYCGYQNGGPLGSTELLLTDDAGGDHVFYFETFYNTHEALTFGIYRGKRAAMVSVAG